MNIIELANNYSEWFFSYGWMIVSAIGFFLGLRIGLKAYYVILPLVCVAVLGRIGGVA